MKMLLLVIILGGSLGFIIDYSVKKIEEGKTFLKKIKNLKQLLNIIVYATGMVLVYFVTFLSINIFFYCLIGGIICTIVEFIYGYLFNILLKLKIWDYSNSIIKIGNKIIPLHILGQVDIWHSICWCFLSIPIYFLVAFIEWLIK